ncbi:MAG TPA: SRPBCC family protein [Candidatus Dormibacteraeota bacterium]|nr:SRPBCC family protein [Candidatus Dormibacteraeota bacterium]
MANLKLSVEIAAPPDRVAVFFVPQRMAYWYGAEIEAEFEVRGGAADFAVGQKLRIAGWLGNRQISLTPVITAHEFGRFLEWRFVDAYGVKGRQRWEIEATPTGARVTMLDEYKMPGRFAWFADWLFTRFAARQRDREHLARLKRLAERR